MDVLKFGFKYWKRNLGLSLLGKLMSCIALSADLDASDADGNVY